MAHHVPLTHQRIFRYYNFLINKRQPLGHGSYGAVYKAKCDQLPCAAKVLHPTILDPNDPGAGRIMERFQQECAFLEHIRHPNVVQYLGMTTDPESRLPVLLMELLDESLTKMLEHSQQPLPYFIQVDICHDIALAVAYLHSNDIIHRDLSSNNVLMIAGRRAKVTDFGMSKLAGAASTTTPLTMCPGTLAYMPPEALREPPRYTKKLDCFSEGVLIIQICTRLWPEPGPRTQIIHDSNSATGIIEVPIPEMERRKNHIDMICSSNLLLPIAVDCLHYQDMERPSSEELCQRLCVLKESSMYRKSEELKQDDILAHETQITSIHHQSQDTKEKALQAKDNQCKIHYEEIELRDRQLQRMKQHMKEQEQIMAEIQQTNLSLQRQVEQLKQQLSQKCNTPSHPTPPSEVQMRRFIQERQSMLQPLSLQSSLQEEEHHLKSHPPRVRQGSLDWKDGGTAPLWMSRGAAAVNKNVMYFLSCGGEVCCYCSKKRRWSMLPKYPYIGGSAAIITDQFTAIGGCEGVLKKRTYTNRLLSLQNKWTHVFPPMPTMRRDTSAITSESKEHLIVAGGSTGPLQGDRVCTVEVMDTESLVWSTVANLPHPYSRASVVMCSDRLYMLGGWDDNGRTKSVLTCSLIKLLQSSSSSTSSVWHRVDDTPDYHSTCTVVNGELLVVGGCNSENKPTATICRYNPISKSWNLISVMPTARYHSLIAILPWLSNEIMVVGGKVRINDDLDTVETALVLFDTRK